MDVLEDHPELAPEVACGVLSKALTAARASNAELEHKLKDHALALKDTQTLYENERASGKKLRDTLQAQYLELRRGETALKEGQEEVRRNTEALQARYDELRTKETDVEESRREMETKGTKLSELQEKETRLDNWRREVEAQMETREVALSTARRLLEEKMEGFKEMTATLVRETQAKAHNLQAHLKATIAEKTELQRALENVKLDLTAKTETCATLSETTRNLEENLTNAQERFDSALADEVGQRRRAETALAEHTSKSAAQFEAYKAASDGTLLELQTRIAALRAEYARVEGEVREMCARPRVPDTTGDAVAESSSGSDMPDAEPAPTRSDADADADAAASEACPDQRAQELEWTTALGELRRELDEAHGRLAEREAANKDLRAAIEARDAQLRAQREKSQARIVKLEESLADADGEHTKLIGTLKQRKVEISELRASLAAAKAETTKLRTSWEASEAEQGSRYEDLRARYTTLYEQYQAASTSAPLITTNDPDPDADKAELKLELEALKKENETLRAGKRTLQEMNKNLQSSVLRAGAQVKEELQRTADAERLDLENANKALGEEVTRLRAVVEVCRRRFQSQPVATSSQTQTAAGVQDNSRDSKDEEDPLARHRLRVRQRQASDDPESSSGQLGRRRPPLEERSMYAGFMKRFPHPADRPPFRRIQSICKAEAFSGEMFLKNFPTGRRTLHCPEALPLVRQRQLSCVGIRPVFVQTSKLAGAVYYAGMYKVHSLREVHPPGALVCSDVSRHAIAREIELHQGSPGFFDDYFPGGEIRTECFGLQCVGFDNRLYATLLAVASSMNAGQKRKAGPEVEDPRVTGNNKLQRV
ncbi:hypothetical protein MVEN_02553800 [Mycena venus]|uniref:Uncharacterized protein n=1 Tax=Mycena venus TaxID=2733690 RepID=A0A8H6WSJ9_9AGAR|nr:hypothetical protein MVEN_02553800 [Mycena venus]